MLEEWQATAIEGGPAGEQSVTVPGRPAALAGSDAVRYKTEFEDPRTPADDVAVLELRGVYADADLEVTGDRLDGEGAVTHDTYFEPLRVPFEPYEDNELVVTCRSPSDRFGGLYETDLVPDEGRVPGIWWDATLEARPLPYVDDITVRPERTDDGVRLHVATTVVASEALSERITYSVKPEGDSRSAGTMERASVETDGPGVQTVEHEVTLRDPSLWWPRELGSQNRYTLRAKLGDSEASVTTGICSVTRADGRLLVNDEPVSIRGINLLTADADDIDRALEVNANLVRAHAHVLPDRVYDRCDEEGLLVWQDLPLTGPGEFDIERGEDLARRLAQGRGRHPSLAAYTVHDDPVASFPDGLGSGLLDRLRLRWRAWRTDYDAGPAESVAEAFPDDRPVVPVVGGPGVGAAVGSYYPGWDYDDADSIESLLARYPADIVAEFGAGALGSAGDGEDVAGFDAAKHASQVEDADQSQAYQATLLETIAGSLRTSGTGSVAFALRDTDSAGMGVYERDGTPKAAVEDLARVYQPIQTFLADRSGGESDVVVVNDLPTSLSTTLAWAGDEESGELDVDVDAHDRWEGGPVTVPDDGILELTLTVRDQQVENVYDLS